MEVDINDTGLVPPPNKPLDKAKSYKGHPQPPIDERLEQAKNFLADEDINRCLGFTGRLDEIEEYVKYIKDEKLECDPDRLKDVTLMIEVHRDWLYRTQERPYVDSDCCNSIPIQNYSSRLLSADTAAGLRQQREQYGIVTQMRNNHPPFTVKRECDHTEFLKAITDDATAHPDTIDPQTNLLWVENGAYARALREPAFIPIWMHPTRGLPTRGLTMTDEQPSYRNPAPRSGRRLFRSPQQEDLFPQLKYREDEINRLLDIHKTGCLSGTELLELEVLLRPYEPSELQLLHDVYEKTLPGTIQEEKDEHARAAAAYEQASNAWVGELMSTGFQIRMLKPNEAIVERPGVFIYPWQETDRTKEIEKWQEGIKALIEKNLDSLTQAEQDKFHWLIEALFPKEYKDAYEQLDFLTSLSSIDARQKDEIRKLEAQLSIFLQDLIQELLDHDVELRELLPGQEAPLPHEPGVFYVPADTITPFQAVRDRETEVQGWENELNAHVKLFSEGKKIDVERVRILWLYIMHDQFPPEMVYIREQLTNLRRDIRTEKTIGGQTRIMVELANMPVSFINWVNRRLTAGHQIKLKALQVGEEPIYYPPELAQDIFQIHWGAKQPPEDTVFRHQHSFINRERRINEILARWAHVPENQKLSSKDRREIYELTKNLQYPELSRKTVIVKVQEAREKAGLLSDVEVANLKVLIAEAADDYDIWLNSLRYTSIRIREAGEDHKDERPGHPVYYRGDQDLSQNEDGFFRKLKNSINSLLRIPSTSEDEVSLLRRHLTELRPPYLRALEHDLFEAEAVSNPSPDDKAELVFIRRRATGAYNAWVKSFGGSIQNITKPPPTSLDGDEPGIVYWHYETTAESPSSDGVQFEVQGNGLNKPRCKHDSGYGGSPILHPNTMPVPPSLIEIQNEINTLLPRTIVGVYNAAQATGVELTRLTTLLEPFMPPHLLALRKRTAQREIDAVPSFLSIEFARALSAWLDTFREQGFRIKVTCGGVDDNDGPGDFYIKLLTPPPTPPPTPPLPPPSDADRAKWAHLDAKVVSDCEDEVNQLLNKKRLSSNHRLNPADMEQLRRIMRPLMYDRLLKLDTDLRELDYEVRTTPQRDSELTSRFESTWSAFNRDFSGWLELFQNKVVQISLPAKGFTPKENKASQILDYGLVPAIPFKYNSLPHPPPIPFHVTGSRDDLKALLSKKPIDLSFEETQRLDLLLRPLWHEYLPAVRDRQMQFLQVRLGKNADQMDPSDLILLEAVIALAYERWKSEWRKLTIDFREHYRGEFQYNLSRMPLYDPLYDHVDYITEATTRENSGMPVSYIEASAAIEQLLNKVAYSETLTQEEQEWFETLVYEPLHPVALKYFKRVVDEFVQKFRREGLTEDEALFVRSMQIQCLLADYGYTHPNYVKDHRSMDGELKPATARSTTDGESPLLSAPRHRLYEPTEIEIAQVETLMNDMLRLQKEHVLDSSNNVIFEHMLSYIAPNEIKYMERRICRLRKAYLHLGLNLSRSLDLVECEKEYERLWAIWKTNFMPELSVRLDSNFVDRTTAFHLFWIAYDWGLLESQGAEAAGVLPKRERQEPLPASKIPAAKLNDWHEIDSLIREYVDKGLSDHGEEGDVKRRLLLSFLPPHLKQQEQAILELMELRKTSGDVENANLSVTSIRSFVPEYMNWYMNREEAKINRFSGKAERRGVQRASIELGLNLLATNQEQQRPESRFRIVQLPSKYESLLPKEVPLCLPIEPWKRPVEQDPFKYTKIMREYRRWKDHDFDVARSYTIVERPGTLPPPPNYQGPFSLPSEAEFTEVTALRQSYLTQLCERLLRANSKAPRPLLADVLRQADVGLHYEVTVPLTLPVPEFYDEVPLEQKHLDALMELAEPSWSEVQLPWSDEYNSSHGSRRELARIKEFLRDLEVLHTPIFPFASFDANLRFEPTDAFLQPPYHPGTRSSRSATTEDLVQAMNVNRTGASGDDVYQWTNEEAQNMLRLLRDHNIVHHNGGNYGWARIPPTGHPENKYIVSRKAAATSHGVTLNTDTNKYEVQYTSDGRKGPAIVQPNKYHFYRQVAFRIGRDIHKLLSTLSNARSSQETLDILGENTEYAYRRMEGLPAVHPPTQLASIETPNPKNISLIKIAADLHKGAPDLAVELGWDAEAVTAYLNADESTLSPAERLTTETIAGRLIQNQIIEEANNNWEPRFPENEHVWGFAMERLQPTTVEEVVKEEDGNGKETRRTVTIPPKIRQFFSMRRFPYDCQPTWQQAVIKASGPIIQEKPKPVQTVTVQKTEEEIRAEMNAPKPRMRHVKNNQFLFGETAYQRAYLSHQIERDLANVPQFQTGTPRRSRGGPPPLDPFTLPQIPTGWTPTSRSVRNAREEWIERLKASSDGPPILELYHTQAEIAAIKDREARAASQRERDQFNKMVEVEFGQGKNLHNLTEAQLAALYQKLEVAKGKEKHDEKDKPKPKKPEKGRRPADIMTGGLGVGDTPAVDDGGRVFISEGGDGVVDVDDTNRPTRADTKRNIILSGPARNTRSKSPEKRDRKRGSETAVEAGTKKRQRQHQAAV